MKNRKITICLTVGMMAASLAAGAWGCGSWDGMSGSAKDLTALYRTESAQTESESQTDAALQTESESQTDAALQSDAASQSDLSTLSDEFAESYMDFSLRLLMQSQKSDSGADVMVSPLSVMMALEMTRNGAVGETLSQMETVLYPDITAEEGKEGLLAFSSGLPDTEKGHLALADSIWFKEDIFIPNENFLKICAADYDAEIYEAPFDEDTLSDINRWVEEGTDGMVKDILNEIPEDAVMYLINAVAFEAEWQDTYHEYQVRDADFYCADGSSATIEMMYSEEWGYLQDENAEGFIKPYAEGYDFVALLPDEEISLEEYIGQLDGATFLQTIKEVDDTIEVNAGLPKFESETSLELSGVLTELGMPLAFDEDAADFSAMGAPSYETAGNIYISRVLHKTYIAVDELGTKAGAATVVEMATGSAMESPETRTVILNRPFLYAIVEKDSGLPVFIGTVNDLGE